MLDDVANLGLGAHTLYKVFSAFHALLLLALYLRLKRAGERNSSGLTSLPLKQIQKLGRVSKAAQSDDESDAEEADSSESRAGTKKQYQDMDRMAERVQMMIEKQLYLAAWFATGWDLVFFQ